MRNRHRRQHRPGLTARPPPTHGSRHVTAAPIGYCYERSDWLRVAPLSGRSSSRRAAFVSPTGREPAPRRRGERPAPAGRQRVPVAHRLPVPSPTPARTRRGLPVSPHLPAALTWTESQLASFPSSSSTGGGGTAMTPPLTGSAQSSPRTRRAGSAALAPVERQALCVHPQAAPRGRQARLVTCGMKGRWSVFAGTEACLVYPPWGGTRPRFGYRPRFYPTIIKGRPVWLLNKRCSGTLR